VNDSLPDGMGVACTVAPGDILVIRVNPAGLSRDMFEYQSDEVSKTLKEKNPDLQVLFIAAEEIAVIRAGGRS
jgi:hypothetical protein